MIKNKINKFVNLTDISVSENVAIKSSNCLGGLCSLIGVEGVGDGNGRP